MLSQGEGCGEDVRGNGSKHRYDKSQTLKFTRLGLVCWVTVTYFAPWEEEKNSGVQCPWGVSCFFCGGHLPQTSGFRSAKQILVVSFATQARAFILSDRNICYIPGGEEQRRGLMPLGLFLFVLFSYLNEAVVTCGDFWVTVVVGVALVIPETTIVFVFSRVKDIDSSIIRTNWRRPEATLNPICLTLKSI